VTDIQFNQSTIQAGASFAVSQNRRTKINTNASTNSGDAIIDVHGYSLTWYGSLQGGAGTLRVKSSGDPGGMLILGTDKIASINPFGTVLPAGTVNLTIEDGTIVQTSGQVTPTGGELGSETNNSGAALAIKIDNGQIRSESGGYTFQRNLILGPGAGSLNVANTPTANVRLVSDNTYTGPTTISSGILMIGQGNPGEPGSIVSSVVNNSGELDFNRVEDLTYGGAINGTGTVTKLAAGK